MPDRTTELNKVIRIATIVTLSFMVCWGSFLVIAQVKPFWVDEWRVIYNLKYKDAVTLWGTLDFMQQFPRAYLEIIKAFTSIFDYSYFVLRLPSYLVGTATIIFSYRLMKKIYTEDNLNRFLFVMILVSSYTFTEYFVEVKQYTMDIFLSLVAVWQLLELLKLRSTAPVNKMRYLVLCACFVICPFFSYTYPIAIAPVFVILFIQSIQMAINKPGYPVKRILLMQWVPLLLGLISIVFFYVLDVSQLMADSGMHAFWGYLLMNHGFDWQLFFVNFYKLFSQVGSGLLFSTILGVLGIISFLFGIYKSIYDLAKNKSDGHALLVLYSTVLLVMVVLLFIAGKLPIGESRLIAFTIPSTSILIIYLLDALKQNSVKGNFSRGITVLLYIGVIGNIYTTFYGGVTGAVYAREMNIYESTENAIILAQARKLPIFITPDVAYPYDKTQNLPFLNTVPGDWVLKTFPAYNVGENTPVFPLKDLGELKAGMRLLPPGITSVLFGDGRSFRVISR